MTNAPSILTSLPSGPHRAHARRSIAKRVTKEDQKSGGLWSNFASILKGLAMPFVACVSWNNYISPWLTSIGIGMWTQIPLVIFGGSIVPMLVSGYASWKTRREAFARIDDLIRESQALMARGKLSESDFNKIRQYMAEYKKVSVELQNMAITIHEKQAGNGTPTQQAEMSRLAEISYNLMKNAKALAGKQYSGEEEIRNAIINARIANGEDAKEIMLKGLDYKIKHPHAVPTKEQIIKAAKQQRNDSIVLK